MNVSANHVRVVKVGPRDGLQNEPVSLPSAERIRLIEMLVAAGVGTMEAGSFVSPASVPQMADGGMVRAALPRRPDLAYPVLVPNLHGLEAARAVNADTVAVFAAATEAFSMRNLNRDRERAMLRFGEVTEAARSAGIRVRGYVSCAIHCPYEGDVSPDVAASSCVQLIEMGCYEVSLCDTTGRGTPAQASAMLEAAARRIPIERLAVHFHDTYGQALVNTLACLDPGVRVLDSSIAGLGGCPFTACATGNLATEDLVYMLHGMGFETGIDFDALVAAGRMVSDTLGRESSSRVALARANSSVASAAPAF